MGEKESKKSFSPFSTLFSRRKFITKVPPTTAAAITAGMAVNGLIAGRLALEGKNFLESQREKIDLLEEMIAFLTPPSPEQLVSECYNLNKEVPLTEDELNYVSWYVVGDSMNFANGRHTGPENKITRQKNSWVQLLVDGVNNARQRLSIHGEWKAYNLARLGSSTIGLVGPEQGEGNIQLGSNDVQNMVATDTGKVMLAIGLNGNNWRETAAYAIGLYDKNGEFRQFLQTIDPNKSIGEIVKDCLPLLTPKLTGEIEHILKLHKKNSREFKDGFEKAITIVDAIQQQRKKQHLPEMHVICTLPINLGIRDVVPYAPPGSKEQGELDYKNIPNAREAIFRITTTIYRSANDVLWQYDRRKGDDKMQISTIPFFGAEKNAGLFAKDGHFNPDGEKFIAQRILSCMTTIARFGREPVKIRLNDAVDIVTES